MLMLCVVVGQHCAGTADSVKQLLLIPQGKLPKGGGTGCVEASGSGGMIGFPFQTNHSGCCVENTGRGAGRCVCGQKL